MSLAPSGVWPLCSCSPLWASATGPEALTAALCPSATRTTHDWSRTLGTWEKNFAGWLKLPASLTKILILCSCFRLCRTLSLCSTSASRRPTRSWSSRRVALKVSWRRMMDMTPESEPLSRYAGEGSDSSKRATVIGEWKEVMKFDYRECGGSFELTFGKVFKSFQQVVLVDFVFRHFPLQEGLPRSWDELMAGKLAKYFTHTFHDLCNRWQDCKSYFTSQKLIIHLVLRVNTFVHFFSYCILGLWIWGIFAIIIVKLQTFINIFFFKMIQHSLMATYFFYYGKFIHSFLKK